MNYSFILDPGIYGIIGSYLTDYLGDISKLIEAFNLQDNQTFYASFLSNRFEEFSTKLIGNQKAYFEILINIEMLYYVNPVIMYDKLKPLYKKYPIEFNIAIKFAYPSEEVVIAITNDLETIKYIWADSKRTMAYYKSKMDKLKEKVKHEETMFEYVYDYPGEKLYKYENIDMKYLKHIITMMEIYKLK